MSELLVLAMALQFFLREALNISTDSQYVAQIVQPLEMPANVAPVSREQQSLLQIQALLWQQRAPAFVGHIRAHTHLSGPLIERNHTANLYTQIIAGSQELTRAQ